MALRPEVTKTKYRHVAAGVLQWALLVDSDQQGMGCHLTIPHSTPFFPFSPFFPVAVIPTSLPLFPLSHAGRTPWPLLSPPSHVIPAPVCLPTSAVSVVLSWYNPMGLALARHMFDHPLLPPATGHLPPLCPSPLGTPHGP